MAKKIVTGQILSVSDINIGKEVFICCGGNSEKHIIRPRLTETEMKKFNIRYPKEETLQEYEEYKRIIKFYALKGYLFNQN
jgi:hypothetical protein